MPSARGAMASILAASAVFLAGGTAAPGVADHCAGNPAP